MTGMILVARLTVLAVLGYSGLSKLGSPEVATAAQDFGLSLRIAKWVGRWLAPTELLVAGLLFFGPTAYLGALAAMALFLIFTALIGWNLWQGRKPACACFGEASGQAISNWTLARDLVFMALAAIVVAAGPSGTQKGIVEHMAAVVSAAGPDTALALIGLLQAAILLGLWARRGAPVASPRVMFPAPSGVATALTTIGWPPGTLAPGFDLPSLDGKRVTLQDLVAEDRNVLLLFTDPNCRPCSALLPEIAQWQERHGEALTIVLVSRRSAFENRAKAEELGMRNVLLQGGAEVAEAYQAEATPVAVIVDGNRRIASRIATGAVEIRQLVEAWVERARRDAPVSVLSPPPPADATRVLAGDPAPPFKLPALRGGDVDLGDFAGRLTVLVFWNPTCGYCRGLAPQLRLREKQQTVSSAQMVFVAAGTRAANEAEGFVSPVLLDDGGAVNRAYGVNGTPSAVLVDAESNAASAVAVGQSEIEALMKRADLMARAARRVQA